MEKLYFNVDNAENVLSKQKQLIEEEEDHYQDQLYDQDVSRSNFKLLKIIDFLTKKIFIK